MSELDRVQISQLEGVQMREDDEDGDLAPLSLTTPRNSGYDTAPHSPAMPRRVMLDTDSVRGSIGDLMNLKQYGSMWSVRSATESIAHAVPLTTVTQKRMIVNETITRSSSVNICVNLQPPTDCMDTQEPAELLTTSQRTERLSRLIREQRSAKTVQVSTNKHQINFILCALPVRTNCSSSLFITILMLTRFFF
jgi:hypothetical protein